MTRRERLENKMDKRRDWARKAETRAADRFNTVEKICEHIPLGQPILVGHHSEKHARADQNRIHNNMSKGVEETHLAQHHREKASGLEMQLKRTVFSDDENAEEMLEARIAKNEQKRDERKKINAAWRKGGSAAVLALGYSQSLVDTIESTIKACSWDPKPFPAFELTNLGARIRSDKQRLEQIRKQNTRKEQAEASGGILVEGEDYVRVTFPEKPSRDILSDLRGNEFHWSSGSWYGRRDKLPSSVLEMLES